MDNILRFDLYHDRRFVLNLPVDVSAHMGFGEFLVADPLLNTLIISHGQGASQFTFMGNQIFTLDVQMVEDYYHIRILHPSERYQRIVMIDPGHGGRHPGAVRNNVRESDLVLSVTRKLLQLIANDGFIRAYTTRNSDVYVSLTDRAQMGNDVADMFVSIHFNAANSTAVNGTETYYRANSHDEFRALTSRRLAEIMHRNQLASLGTNDRQVRTANFAVLRYSTIPAVLLEPAFMSNPAEFARIQSTEFQWALARAIYNSMLEAFAFVPQR
jgi:N-acetylmuramoyl-L-alanine amidase